MITYLVRRLLLAVITLVAITFIVYGLARNMPGSPLTVQLGEVDPSRKLSAEDQERLKEIYGIDEKTPWYVGYATWLGNLARGDLGRSFSRKQPVTTLIGERIGPTFLISGISLLLTWLIAVPAACDGCAGCQKVCGSGGSGGCAFAGCRQIPAAAASWRRQ